MPVLASIQALRFVIQASYFKIAPSSSNFQNATWKDKMVSGEVAVQLPNRK
jgi:hypothetical protein